MSDLRMCVFYIMIWVLFRRLLLVGLLGTGYRPKITNRMLHSCVRGIYAVGFVWEVWVWRGVCDKQCII